MALIVELVTVPNELKPLLNQEYLKAEGVKRPEMEGVTMEEGE
jgi:hypothetical protein